MLKSIKRRAVLVAGVIGISILGWSFGVGKKPASWTLFINNKRAGIPVHFVNNTYYVALNDLAQLRGWKVTMDLSAKKAWIRTPGIRAAVTVKKPAEAPAAQTPNSNSPVDTIAESGNPPSPDGIEESAANSGPPNNVRLTVEAALASLGDVNQAIQNNLPLDEIKQKNQTTEGIVQQAQNLLWTLPRTRTLQADLQVAAEDLKSQITLAAAAPQAQKGILPWLHPVAESLLMKYPDLAPCHVTQNKVDGVDLSCAKKALSDITGEDFNDIKRDLDQYR